MHESVLLHRRVELWKIKEDANMHWLNSHLTIFMTDQKYAKKFDFNCNCSSIFELKWYILFDLIPNNLYNMHKTCNVVWQWDMGNKDRGYKENTEE